MEGENTSGKELVLLTAGFPFGNSEPFLETEIIYLSGVFRKVTIFYPDNQGFERRLPTNVALVPMLNDGSLRKKIFSLLQLLNPLFWKECAAVRKREGKRISFLQAKTALVSLFRAKEIQNLLQVHFPENEGGSVVFYSYWCDDSALALALRKSGKRVCRAHGWDVYFEANSSQYLPFRSFIATALDAVLPISEKGLSYIQERWNIENSTNIYVHRLGVQAQNQQNGRSETFHLVSCSAVIALKRVDLIAEALALLPESLQIRWTHFGDGPEMEKVVRLTKQLKNNVAYSLKGSCSNQEVLLWYQSTSPDLFINVSTTEGIPVSIMEAMSFGVPAIGTNVGGISEIVNETNGKLISVDSTAQEIADCIQVFLEMSMEERMYQREQALLTWKLNYNAEVNYVKFTDFLNGLQK